MTEIIDVAKVEDIDRTTQQRGPNPVLTVFAWELRRRAALRSTWIASTLAFLFFMLIVLLLRDSQALSYGQAQFANGVMLRPDTVRVVGTSAWGMSITMPKYLLLVLGIVFIFIAAEGVARDFRRRTHEILMATRVPSWAFVIGRYAAIVVVGLGLSLAMLAATLAAGLLLYMSFGYPAPNLPATLALWAVAVLPATILVTSISFALGTLMPRSVNGVKIVLLTAWVLSQFSAALWEHEQSPYAVIDPAGLVMVQVIGGPYAREFSTRLMNIAQDNDEQPVRYEQALQVVRDVEQMMPDMGPWVPPRLIYTGFGIASVGFAALRFRRFRGL